MSDSNLRSLFRLDGVVTTLSGLLMLGIPEVLINWLQLGSITPMWVRIVGGVWLLFGIWLFTIWNATYTKGIAAFAAIVLALNGDLLVLAPLFGNLGIGVIGWIAMLGTAGFIFYVAWQWFLLWRRLPA